jgi:hypothetical protein
MTATETIDRKIKLKCQYYELLEEEIQKVYSDLLNLIMDNIKLQAEAAHEQQAAKANI